MISKSLRYDTCCFAAIGSSSGSSSRFDLLLCCAWKPFGGHCEATWRPRSAVVTGSPCVSTIIARRSWKSLHYDPACFADTGSFSSGSARFGLLLSCAKRPFGGHLDGTWRSLGGHLEATWKLLGSYLDATWAHKGPSCAPRGSKLGPRGGQEAPSGAQEARSWLQEAPSWLQKAPNTLQEAPKTLQ